MKKVLLGLIVLVALLSMPMAAMAADVVVSADIASAEACTPPASIDLGTLEMNAQNQNIDPSVSFSIMWYNPWQVTVGDSDDSDLKAYLVNGDSPYNTMTNELLIEFDGGGYLSIDGTALESDDAGPFTYPLYFWQPVTYDDNPGSYTVTTVWTCSDQ